MNFGIITAGNIASKMAETVAKMPDITAYAIAASDLQKAKAFCDKYDFNRAYSSYDELFCDAKVDIAYIGATHELHFDLAKRALMHGKHVLCEKPVTVNAPQALQLHKLANEKGLIFADATWTRYMPFVRALQAVLENEEIGQPMILECSFGFKCSNVARMTSPLQAGGALLDLGIYPLTMALICFGGEKADIDGVCVKTASGVDAQNAFTLTFESGKLAVLKSSMLCEMSNSAVIYGTDGRIEIPHFWNADGFCVYSQTGIKKEHCFPHEISGYEYEVRSLAKAIKIGAAECAELPFAETLRVMKYLDTLRAKWGIKYPFE